jgi:hypothetical protein
MITIKNSQKIKKLKITIIFAILGFIFALTYMNVHEQVHTAIFRSYEISSTSQVNWFTASTSPMNITEYYQKCDTNCHLANNMTDVVGYHLAILIFCMTGLFYINQMLKDGTNEKDK